MGDVRGFSYLNHALCFSSIIVEPWGHGCAGLPSLGVKALDVAARGRPVGLGPTIDEGSTNY
jgi:hypothetical protein